MGDPYPEEEARRMLGELVATAQVDRGVITNVVAAWKKAASELEEIAAQLGPDSPKWNGRQRDAWLGDASARAAGAFDQLAAEFTTHAGRMRQIAGILENAGRGVDRVAQQLETIGTELKPKPDGGLFGTGVGLDDLGEGWVKSVKDPVGSAMNGGFIGNAMDAAQAEVESREQQFHAIRQLHDGFSQGATDLRYQIEAATPDSATSPGSEGLRNEARLGDVGSGGSGGAGGSSPNYPGVGTGRVSAASGAGGAGGAPSTFTPDAPAASYDPSGSDGHGGGAGGYDSSTGGGYTPSDYRPASYDPSGTGVTADGSISGYAPGTGTGTGTGAGTGAGSGLSGYTPGSYGSSGAGASSGSGLLGGSAAAGGALGGAVGGAAAASRAGGRGTPGSMSGGTAGTGAGARGGTPSTSGTSGAGASGAGARGGARPMGMMGGGGAGGGASGSGGSGTRYGSGPRLGPGGRRRGPAPKHAVLGAGSRKKKNRDDDGEPGATGRRPAEPDDGFDEFDDE